jgi:non-specific serine/threonine protein kinase
MQPAELEGDLGDLLREVRLAAGLTQESLAERAGISARSLERAELGLARPRRDTLQRLLRALELPREQRAALEAAAQVPGPRPGRPGGDHPPIAEDQRRRRRALVGPTINHTAPALPVPVTPLIGREGERESLRQQLLHPEARLLTLTGVGGVGKTRLALDLAIDLQDAFPDGVVWIVLAPLADATLVPSAVAATAGVVPAPGVSASDALIAAWRERALLVVLDNCEHLLDACARLVALLLARCPALRILATSREPLQIAGERQWRVPPLAAPNPEQLPPFDELAQSPAVRLFVERAQAVAPTFRLTEHNAAGVVGVCARLDGLPLALELAAPLTRVLAVEQLRERLDDRFRVLTGGGRTAPARQQTLRAAVDWSYDHLDRAARQLFARLGVFAGGFTLEAAEAVGTDEAAEDVLSVFARLIDASLVVAEVPPEGRGRCHLLETLQAYARERLQAEGDLEAARARHAAFYLRLAERGVDFVPERDLSEPAIIRLVPERHNLRAALDWYREQGQPTVALRLGKVLAGVWYKLGQFAAGLSQLAALVDLARTIPPSGDSARLLEAASGLAHQRGDYPTARALVDEALAIARRLDDPALIAHVLNVLGPIAREQGDLATSRRALEEALARFRDLGDGNEIGAALIRVGEVAHVEGDYAEAQRYYEASIAAWAELGIRVPRASHQLGLLALDRGDLAQARHWMLDCLRRQVDQEERTWLHATLAALACLAAAEGRSQRALYLAGAMEAQCERAGAVLQPTERGRFEVWLDRARRALDLETVRAAWAKGRATPLEQVVAEALGETTAEGAAAMPPRPDEASRAPLTRREREVAELLARGVHRDRDIAAALTIAETTAGLHVRRILAKLGLHSRWEIAAWVSGPGRRTIP